MAGRGPSPKAQRSRGRDTDLRELVKSDGKLGGFELPEDALEAGEEWHPMTVRWWEAWRASPQGVRMVTEVDWYFLLDTALMHHTMWSKNRWEFAAEVRLRAAKFGATPEDRLRLKLEVEVPEDSYPVGTPKGGANVTRMDDHRSRWAS
jgi:hypothetical protein